MGRTRPMILGSLLVVLAAGCSGDAPLPANPDPVAVLGVQSSKGPPPCKGYRKNDPGCTLEPGETGPPTFSQVDGDVVVSWEPADRATRYYYPYGSDRPAAWGGATTDTVVTLDLSADDEVCVVAANEHGTGTMACAVYAG